MLTLSNTYYYTILKENTTQELRAILIDCIPKEMSAKDAAHRLEEADSLVRTYGGVSLLKTVQRRMQPHYKTYIGSGKAQELKMDALSLGANIIIVNNELKPAQVFALSELYQREKIEVWDRIDLILKIFQKHASTKEARLEIELASIRHMGPRIFGMGMELSRQGGGIGTRGIGETNTEIMRRHLGKGELRIKKELEACRKARSLHMDRRKRQNFKTVGIIGYTNAGKSSLLNALTKKGALAEDKLFATLDTRVGKTFLPNVEKEILLSDTIGFIQDLPHTLINSFQSTLAETIHADLLLHVIDASDPRVKEKIDVVHDVLQELEVNEKEQIYVFNKTDLGTHLMEEEFEDMFYEYSPVFVSVKERKGLDELKTVIGERLFKNEKR